MQLLEESCRGRGPHFPLVGEGPLPLGGRALHRNAFPVLQNNNPQAHIEEEGKVQAGQGHEAQAAACALCGLHAARAVYKPRAVLGQQVGPASCNAGLGANGLCWE